MNADNLLENFEILADAPGGIDRLRELLLHLGVSGKLLPQISAEVREEILWSVDSLRLDEHRIWGENYLENSPATWPKVPLARLGSWGSGGTPARGNKAYYDGEIPWLVIGDLNDGVVTRAANSITKKGLEESSATIVPVGAVFVAMYGSIGKSGIAGFECATNQAIAHCVPDPKVISTEYLFLIIRAVKPRLFSQGRGLAQQNISQTVLKHLMISVPPLAEQKRIVAKVDELMALCDQLEQIQQSRDNLRIATRKSAIDAVSIATTPEELETAWKRINNNWELIADTPESVDSLRGLILGLAVSDRLVQSTGVEFTSEVMNLETPSGTWANFAPMNWKCLTLEDAADQITDGTHQTPKYMDDGVPFLSIKDISGGKIDFSRTRFISPKEHQTLTRRVKPQRGDVLICRIGTLGRTVSIETDKEFSIFVSLGLIRPKKFISPRFLAFFMNSPISYKQFDAIKAGGSHTVKLNLGSLRKYVLWIPPLNVQELILSKIDELMMLCDQLEAGLMARSELAEKFARSVVSAT
jgi:type I restriction enzyme S subunit